MAVVAPLCHGHVIDTMKPGGLDGVADVALAVRPAPEQRVAARCRGGQSEWPADVGESADA